MFSAGAKQTEQRGFFWSPSRVARAKFGKTGTKWRPGLEKITLLQTTAFWGKQTLPKAPETAFPACSGSLLFISVCVSSDWRMGWEEEENASWSRHFFLHLKSPFCTRETKMVCFFLMLPSEEESAEEAGWELREHIGQFCSPWWVCNSDHIDHTLFPSPPFPLEEEMVCKRISCTSCWICVFVGECPNQQAREHGTTYWRCKLKTDCTVIPPCLSAIF